MIQVGDKMPHKVRLWERKGSVSRSIVQTLPCEVIYIHPSRRWCTLLVSLPFGRQFRISEFLASK